jgi:hypothetical protein
MFQLRTAATAAERIGELERFVEFWYGPRRPEFGEPAALTHTPPLPEPLRRFYAFAGRWPAPDAGPDGEFFYTGESGHHLLPLGDVRQVPDGKLRFFMEYQGDWYGLTLPGEPDPPVWITGRWDDPEPGEGTRQLSESLSSFLVTHCLMGTTYEWSNSPAPRSSSKPFDDALAAWFRREQASAELLWQVEPGGCPAYEGSFYLLRGHVLVHDTGRKHFKFGALHPEGVDSLREVIGDNE